MNGLGILFSLLTLFTLTNSAHADPKYYLYKKMMHERMARLERGSPAAPTPAPQFMEQTLDHFAQPSARAVPTFKQKYFVDATYAANKDSPVIYYLCGEAACEGASDTELVNTIAKKYKAYRVALEHRYYGESQPFTKTTPANLKYLSMDQALEDLASFQKFISNKMGLTGKWIVVGGSYAGEMAAFYRLKHPELVVGALASSGPVLAKADFFEYDRHVATVVPAACLAAIKTAVKDIETKLGQPTTSRQVKTLFKAAMLTNDVDFLYVVADMAATAIQYGYQDDFCNAMTSPAGLRAPTESYAKVGTKVFTEFGITPLQDSFQGLMDTSTTSELGKTGLRAWMYQSCTEFGFFQIANADTTHSARSAQITLPYHQEACKRLFGITAPVDTGLTNRTFFDHLASPQVTRIFFTNGMNDPWSNLSLNSSSATASANPNLDFMSIAGAAHCDDLGSRDSPELKAARAHFDVLVNQWLTATN